MTHADPHELNKFKHLSEQWWDPSGPMWGLHRMNPTRCQFIERILPNISSLSCIDIGCGAGILTESLATLQPKTLMGIDLVPELITVAKMHDASQNIDYQHRSIESLIEEQLRFDVVICLEMIEHVPEPQQLIQDLTALLNPHGTLIISTINRNPASYLMTIGIAEHLLGWVPVGTHQYSSYIKPHELDHWCEENGLQRLHRQGLMFNPLTQGFQLSALDIANYIAAYRR